MSSSTQWLTTGRLIITDYNYSAINKKNLKITELQESRTSLLIKVSLNLIISKIRS